MKYSYRESRLYPQLLRPSKSLEMNILFVLPLILLQIANASPLPRAFASNDVAAIDADISNSVVVPDSPSDIGVAADLSSVSLAAAEPDEDTNVANSVIAPVELTGIGLSALEANGGVAVVTPLGMQEGENAIAPYNAAQAANIDAIRAGLIPVGGCAEKAVEEVSKAVEEPSEKAFHPHPLSTDTASSHLSLKDIVVCLQSALGIPIAGRATVPGVETIIDPPYSFVNARRTQGNPIDKKVRGEKIPRLPHAHEHDAIEGYEPNWINVYPDGTQEDLRHLSKVEHKEEVIPVEELDVVPVVEQAAPAAAAAPVKRDESAWSEAGVSKKMKFAAGECGMAPPGNTFLKAAKQGQPRIEELMANRPRYVRSTNGGGN
jgi:hypothetical protein